MSPSIVLSVVYHQLCYPFFHYLIHWGLYSSATWSEAAGRRVYDKVPARRKRSFLSKRALVQSRIQCSLVQVLLQTLKVQFGAFRFSLRHSPGSALMVGFTYYTVATGLLMYS